MVSVSGTDISRIADYAENLRMCPGGDGEGDEDDLKTGNEGMGFGTDG